MSIQAPQGILNIPNATLRVGKLVLDEIVGADTIMNTVARNTILLVDDTEYTANKNWALKLPNAWAGVFDIKTTGAGKYAEFNFYNEGASSNAQGYNLTFNDTAVELRYDGGSALVSGTVSTVVNTYRKVHLLFERNILSVTVDGTLIFTYTDTSGPRPRVYSTTAGGFLYFFTDGGAIDTLKIVNEKWISDGTSNIAYVGGNLGIGVAAPGSKLSVTGNAYVSSNLAVGGNVTVSSNLEVTGNVTVSSDLAVTGDVTISSNLAVDTNTLFVDTVNNRTGIGTTTPQKTLEVAGPMRITDGLSNVCDLSVVNVASGSWDTGTKIQASDPGANDQFGYSVSMSSDGTKVIVGAAYEDTGGTDAGAAYIYAYSSGSWSQEAKIQASVAQVSDNFGWSVSMNSDGTKVIMGARLEDTGGTDAGAAYIFALSGGSWSQEAKIVASDAQASDEFGLSVSMSGDGTRVIVGAYLEDPGGTTNAGAAYIFALSGGSWSQEAKIVASDAQGTDRFGESVSMSSDGTRVIVGAWLEDTVGTNAGAAYIFALSGGSWSQQQKIVASDAQSSDYFGTAVSMNSDGTKVLVGAYGEATGAYLAGAAYIFALSGGSWSQEAKIMASDPQSSDQFGYSVSMNSDGTRVIVGARYEDTGGTDAGSAYIFALSGGSWSQEVKIVASDAQGDDYFGWSVSMNSDGTKVIVGAPYEDTGGSSAGAAYIFEAPVITTLTSSTPISADGTTLSFTGQHICVPEGPMSPGLVVSANKNRYVSLNGTLTTGMGAIRSSESLPVVSLSNVVSDRSVFGVVDRLEQGGTTERRQVLGATVVTAQKELGDTRVIVNSLGEGAIWVADTNGPLVSGDYMTTSHLTGYGQKQDSEFLANYTVAKITMDCDFDPDDVPIQVIKKKDTGDNDLDVYGRIQWEDHPLKTTQKAYVIRYLTVDGNRTDEANAVHRTAFVGCTYHCG